jgi:arginyl-tRNA--protein-N-Asp/Glu arginylyltransferase
MEKKLNITEFFEENKQCPYYEDKKSDTRYRFIQSCDIDTYDKMLQRGWRRFGNVHFVPECSSCNDCKTIRLDIQKFTYSKSQKRILNKNNDLDVYVQKPSLSIEHINLFNKYHTHMSKKKLWKDNIIDASEYKASYVDGAGEYGKEILYFLGNKLIAVALCDMTQNSFSSVYCFYDHEYASRSLGKYSILAQISMAKQANIPYIFLGYWIKDHYSMGYKEDYTPFDILQNRPDIHEECIWQSYEK